MCCVPVWLCFLNLTIQLVSNFTNTNMSPYFSIPMIKVWIWFSLSLVVLEPSIKFDQLWLNFDRDFLQIQLFNCDHNLLELTFHYILRIQWLNFKTKDDAWWTYVVYWYDYVLLIWSFNWSQISPTPICYHTLQSQWSRFEYEFHQVQWSWDHLLSSTEFV